MREKDFVDKVVAEAAAILAKEIVLDVEEIKVLVAGIIANTYAYRNPMGRKIMVNEREARELATKIVAEKIADDVEGA